MRRSLLIAALTLAIAACATPGGKSGRAHTLPATPATQRLAIIAQANAMLGQPYRWGGAAPGGFDCSGLVVYATAAAGLQLPRTAHEQRRAAKRIARADLEAGDLVFMHLARKELHVGIALDDHRFIHAPSSGGVVRVDSLKAQPYARGFLEARRVVAGESRSGGAKTGAARTSIPLQYQPAP